MLKGLGSRFLVILGFGDVWGLVRCRVVGVSRLGFRAWGGRGLKLSKVSSYPKP